MPLPSQINVIVQGGQDRQRRFDHRLSPGTLLETEGEQRTGMYELCA